MAGVVLDRGLDGAAGGLPEDEEVHSKPFGNCLGFVLIGGFALAGAQVTDLAGMAPGDPGEFADAD